MWEREKIMKRGKRLSEWDFNTLASAMGWVQSSYFHGHKDFCLRSVISPPTFSF